MSTAPTSASTGVTESMTSTSPFGSWSLRSTGSAVVRPGRAPRSSSTATGGCCTRSASGGVSAVFCSTTVSERSRSMRSDQLSMRPSPRCTAHAAPPRTSFSTTRAPSTRKRRAACAGIAPRPLTAPRSVRRASPATSSGSVAGARQRCQPDPSAQPACSQPATRTGRAGSPRTSAVTTTGSPPATGTSRSPPVCATSTPRPSADARCRATRASAATDPERSTARPSTRRARASASYSAQCPSTLVSPRRCPAGRPASPAATVSPATAAAGSAPASACSSAGAPTGPTSTVSSTVSSVAARMRESVPASAEYTRSVPSSSIDATASAPSARVGALAASNAASPATGTSQSWPVAGTRIAARDPASMTSAPAGSGAVSTTSLVASSTTSRREAPRSASSTVDPPCSTSMSSLRESTTLSSSSTDVLARPIACCAELTTHTEPSSRSTRCAS
ncbi:hypothetical protein BFL35_01655 [Clavibacter michiganensis]|nr:hypothetical protein BFL35_01655 [Clavibacter michiganensis]